MITKKYCITYDYEDEDGRKFTSSEDVVFTDREYREYMESRKKSNYFNFQIICYDDME